MQQQQQCQPPSFHPQQQQQQQQQSQPARPGGLMLNGKRFLLVNTTLMLFKLLDEYLSVADSSPLYCVELGQHVVDLIRLFNNQSCQLVLGAGAVRTAGLRSISAKHLALSCESCYMLAQLIPALRTVFLAPPPASPLPQQQPLQQQLVQGDDVGSDSLGGIWHEMVGLMTPTESTMDARLAIRFTGAGYLCIEWVSLMPEDAWNPPKADAQENTKDAEDEDEESKAADLPALRFSDKPYPFNRALVKALSDMQPQFMRFPGGAFVEGVDLGTALRWKSTVGPPERRPGHPNANWGYWSTDGLGLFEFMELAEELDTEPVWVVNVGISQSESTNPDQLISDGWLQDTLDALEFILEDAAPEKRWANLRASMGRDLPWSLTYVTLGNEECLRPWYAQHYERVASAIRARYSRLKLIANCDLGPGFDYAAWEFHTYRDAGSTFRLRTLFDEYQGRPVAVTEFAAMTSAETVQGAIAEAGLMTAMERNCDKFMMGAFAPLLGHAQLRSWRPNLIVFGSDGSWYGTPSYEVQKLFMNSAGSYCGQVRMDGSRDSHLDASLVCKDELCSSSATKIVNYGANATEILLRLKPLPLSKMLDRFSPGMMQHPKIAKLPLWELSSQNPSIDSNGFMKPRVLSPREKYSVIRNIGRGWREANIHLPPYSMVLVEVKDVYVV
uniref:non-reducing end alpha-L-arabinofuranosidase n=1 Tax=Dunaliella tertiolecta TaxID=3047 RepID=A0A7S3QV46_DUNTE